jgi:hypothetical protein
MCEIFTVGDLDRDSAEKFYDQLPCNIQKQSFLKFMSYLEAECVIFQDS